MADQILRSKIAFGSSESVASAKESGKIDSFDILCLDGDTNPKIGWLDKDGNYRLVKNQDVILVTGDALPETGEEEIIYIFNSVLYYWNGSEFIAAVSEGGVSEDAVDTKIETAVSEANAYTDQKIAEVASGYEIVEF